MLNSLERIGKLAQGQMPDRVPVVCNLFEQGARELGMSIKEYYSKPEYVAEGQIKLQEKYGYDCIWGFMYTAVISEIVGCRNIIYSEDGPPNAGHMVIKDFKDIDTFEIPDNIEDTEAMQNWLKCISMLINEVGHKLPVLSAMVSSFTLPAILMGMEKWFELLLLGDAGLRDEMLRKCALLNEKLINSFRKTGVAMISYSNPMSGKEFLTFEQFKQMCLPWVKEDFKNTGTQGIVYFNGGSPINHILDTLITEVQLGAFYLHPDDDISIARKNIAGRGLCAGVINDIKLLSMTPDEVKNEVTQIINSGKDGGGFIFGTLVMPFNIPEQNIITMIETAHRIGNYSEVQV